MFVASLNVRSVIVPRSLSVFRHTLPNGWLCRHIAIRYTTWSAVCFIDRINQFNIHVTVCSLLTYFDCVVLLMSICEGGVCARVRVRLYEKEREREKE